MATTDEELKSLQEGNAEKRNRLMEQERKAAELRKLIQNDQTKDALVRESKQLDTQLEQAAAQIKALEEAAGTSVDSVEPSAPRPAEASVEPVAPAPIMTPTESTEGTTAQVSSKRGSK